RVVAVAEPQALERTVVGEGHDRQRASRVKEPELVRAQAVQRRDVAAPKQVVDGGRKSAIAVVARRQSIARDRLGGAIGLTVKAAFGVRSEVEPRDPARRLVTGAAAA